MIEPPYVAFSEVLEPELVDLLRQLGDGLDREAAKVGSDRAVNEQARKAEVGFFSREHWVTGLFFHFGALANAKAWRFEVRGVGTVQVATYDQGGHQTWHADSGPSLEGLERKLTVLTCLSDVDQYAGGEFEIMTGGGPKKIEEAGVPGSVVIFPAYMPHRVLPVTQGVRRSIVAWLIGPAFR